METPTEALDRLEAAGYDIQFFVREGQFACPACNRLVAPEDVIIEDVVRFEGESDPEGEMTIYALACGPCGRKGTYTVGFGPEMAPEDIDVVLRLNDGRRG